MFEKNNVGKILKLLALFAAIVFAKQICAAQTAARAIKSDKISIYAIRLTPGQDLRQELERFAKENRLDAAFIITTVGSLRAAKIRLADQDEATALAGKFEIVSLVGTLSQNGSHLHLSIADKTGTTTGGHLVEGCAVYTTAEIIVGAGEDLMFTREPDAESGYKELKIRRKIKSKKR